MQNHLELAEGVEPSSAAGGIAAVLPLDHASIRKAPEGAFY